jgi:O-antigen ligase
MASHPTAARVGPRELPGWLLVAGAVVGAVIVGAAASEAPLLAGALVATIVCLPLLVSPRARVLWVVFGALIFFGTTDEITPGKIAYLYGIAFALLGSLLHARAQKGTTESKLLGPFFWTSGAFAVLAAVSLPVSMLNETPQTDWVRDLAPYVMFAAAPLFALDAQAAFSRRALERVLAIAGLFAAVSFGVTWVTQRGIADLSAVPAGFPSTMLAAGLVAYGCSMLLQSSERRGRWLLLTAMPLALLFVTGTRTTVILLLAPLAIVFGSLQGMSVRALRLAVALPVLAIVVGLSLQSILRASDADADQLQRRLALLLSTGGRNDQSFRERLSQTEAARDVFAESPVLGAGPGVKFEWFDSLGDRFVTPSVDTPIGFVSKFGLLGLVWIVIVFASWIVFYRQLRRRGRDPTPPQLALVGFGAVVVGHSFLLVSIEDKGLPSALLLLLALALVDLREQSALRPDERGGSAA